MEHPDFENEVDDDDLWVDAEEADELEPASDEWTVEYVKGLYDLDAKLGRRLTERELEAIEERIGADPTPDVQAAYDKYYETARLADGSMRVPPDLGTPAGRKAYMAERLRETDRGDF